MIMQYYLYNFILKTDIFFEMLVECKRTLREEDTVISLLVNQDIDEQPEYIVPFKEGIKYYLYPNKNRICVVTEIVDYIYSSFFNIPMSAFSLFKQSAIIHCNALEYNNELYCFSGDKTIGKTTLAMFLSKYCSVFSDDCVALKMDFDDKIYGYRAARTLKLCKQTYDMVIDDDCYEQYFDSISQKAIILLPDMQYKTLPIKKMFFLVRGNERKFICEEVNSNITKKILLIQSVLGKDYLTRNVIELFGYTKLFSQTINNIPFYILKIPPIEEYDSEVPVLFDEIIM